MSAKILELAGRRYAILPEKEYRRLRAKADAEGPWPALPRPDGEGNVPAVAYARASLARKIVKARRAAGLTQAALARRATIRPETLNRIEKGKTTPDTATIAKIAWGGNSASRFPGNGPSAFPRPRAACRANSAYP
jgi:DNA-binding XRE family transcriptional regulator